MPFKWLLSSEWLTSLFRESRKMDVASPEVFLRSDVVRENQQKIKRKTQVTFDIGIIRSDLFYEIADLNRQATAYSAAGNLEAAVASLRRAAELNKHQIENNPTEGIRLALYLQKAGQGEEAVIEMKRLIALIPGAVLNLQYQGAPGSRIQKSYFEANLYAALLDKMRLILHREKRKDASENYGTLEKQWRERAAALYRKIYLKQIVRVPSRPDSKGPQKTTSSYLRPR